MWIRAQVRIKYNGVRYGVGDVFEVADGTEIPFSAYELVEPPTEGPDEVTKEQNFEDYTVKELQHMAKELGLDGYRRLTKAKLIERLTREG